MDPAIPLDYCRDAIGWGTVASRGGRKVPELQPILGDELHSELPGQSHIDASQLDEIPPAE
jgi:hypothetical protein